MARHIAPDRHGETKTSPDDRKDNLHQQVSVVIMAFSSVLGVVVKSLTTGMQPGVFENWMAAAPVVALGAPLGVFIVNLIGRKPTLLVVAALCVGQFIWTCYVERHALEISGLIIALAAMAGCILGFEKLRALGAQLANACGTNSEHERNVAPALSVDAEAASRYRRPRTRPCRARQSSTAGIAVPLRNTRRAPSPSDASPHSAL